MKVKFFTIGKYAFSRANFATRAKFIDYYLRRRVRLNGDYYGKTDKEDTSYYKF